MDNSVSWMTCEYCASDKISDVLCESCGMENTKPVVNYHIQVVINNDAKENIINVVVAVSV